MALGQARIVERGDTFLAIGADHSVAAGESVEYRISLTPDGPAVFSGFANGPINNFLVYDSGLSLTPDTTYWLELIHRDSGNNVVDRTGLWGITAGAGFVDTPSEPGESFNWCGEQYLTPGEQNDNQVTYRSSPGYGGLHRKPATRGAGANG